MVYMEVYNFKVITGLNSTKSPSKRFAGWALELQQYDFEIAYKGALRAKASVSNGECNWIRDIFPDYAFEGETLYRLVPHRAGNEDVVASGSLRKQPSM